MKRLTRPLEFRSGNRPRRSVLDCRSSIWLAAATVGFVLAEAVPASGQRLQDVSNPVVLQAIDAYDAGDLARALQLLESAPAALPAPEGAIRALFTGLVRFAQGEPLRAREAFMLAVRLDPTASLDPDVHAPSRIAAFQAARDALLAEWRVQADQSMATGDTAQAVGLWRNVLSASPDDAMAQSRIDAVEEAQRLTEAARQAEADRLARAAAAEDSLRQRFGEPPDSTPPPPVEEPELTDTAATMSRAAVYNPGQALAMGLVVPGLGQMYAGRGLLGVLSLAAAGGAAAAGILFERVSVDCRVQPVGGTCPPGDILDQRTERPYMVAGVAGAAAVTLIGALDAFFAARRANERAATTQAGVNSAGLDIGPDLRVGVRTIQVEWARIRF